MLLPLEYLYTSEHCQSSTAQFPLHSGSFFTVVLQHVSVVLEPSPGLNFELQIIFLLTGGLHLGFSVIFSSFYGQ